MLAVRLLRRCSFLLLLGSAPSLSSAVVPNIACCTFCATSCCATVTRREFETAAHFLLYARALVSVSV